MSKRLISKEQLITALRNTTSFDSAAEYLSAPTTIVRRLAKAFKDEVSGKSFYEIYKNIHKTIGRKKGIKKNLTKNDEVKLKHSMKEVFEDGFWSSKYTPNNLWKYGVKYGYLHEKCNLCEFDGFRIIDGKRPLMLYFKDSNKHNWKIDNITVTCLNCYYIYFSDSEAENHLRELINNKRGRKSPTLIEDAQEEIIKMIEDVPEIVNEDDELHKYVTRKLK